MNIKRIPLLLIFILLVSYCSSNNENFFEKDIAQYCEDYNNREWQKVMDKIYPKLFNIIPRETILETFSKVDSAGLVMNMAFKKIEKISEPVASGNEVFRLINYNTLLTVTLKEIQWFNAEIYKQGFEAAFGKENVKFDKDNHKFEIDAHQRMLAISEKNSNDWKYIEQNEASADYITKEIIPEDVISKLLK